VPRIPSSRPAAVLLTWLLLLLPATLSASCGGRARDGREGAATPQPAQAAASPVPWKTIEPPTQVGIPLSEPKPQQTAVFRTYSGIGVVRQTNLKEGWVEIDHEDIADVMPGMRMIWRVKDRDVLKSVSAGDKVNFTVEDNNGSELITELKKASPDR